MPQAVDRKKDWKNEGDPQGLKFIPGRNVIRVVLNDVEKAMVHWGTGADGIRRRAVCPGKFKRRGLNDDVCPICKLIKEQGAGDDGSGWGITRRYYMAGVRVKMVEREIKKGPHKGEFAEVPVVGDLVELIGGRDGMGVKVFNAMVGFMSHPQYGSPLGYNFEVKREGEGLNTEYTVTPQLPNKSGKIPADLNDPEDLLGEGLKLFVEPTSIEQIEEWIGIGATGEIDLEDDDLFEDEDEEVTAEDGAEDDDDAPAPEPTDDDESGDDNDDSDDSEDDASDDDDEDDEDDDF